MNSIPEKEGRIAFGANVHGYDESRPEYPAWMFDVLVCCPINLFKNAVH